MESQRNEANQRRKKSGETGGRKTQILDGARARFNEEEEKQLWKKVSRQKRRVWVLSCLTGVTVLSWFIEGLFRLVKGIDDWKCKESNDAPDCMDRNRRGHETWNHLVPDDIGPNARDGSETSEDEGRRKTRRRRRGSLLTISANPEIQEPWIPILSFIHQYPPCLWKKQVPRALSPYHQVKQQPLLCPQTQALQGLKTKKPQQIWLAVRSLP
jgi:hypothetical protein